MAKKELSIEEKQALYEEAMAKITAKRDKRLVQLADKKVRLTEKLTKKYADNPEKLEQELGILTIDNDVWIDIAEEQFTDRAKTLELKYLK